MENPLISNNGGDNIPPAPLEIKPIIEPVKNPVPQPFKLDKSAWKKEATGSKSEKSSEDKDLADTADFLSSVLTDNKKIDQFNQWMEKQLDERIKALKLGDLKGSDNNQVVKVSSKPDKRVISNEDDEDDYSVDNSADQKYEVGEADRGSGDETSESDISEASTSSALSYETKNKQKKKDKKIKKDIGVEHSVFGKRSQRYYNNPAGYVIDPEVGTLFSNIQYPTLVSTAMYGEGRAVDFAKIVSGVKPVVSSAKGFIPL
jgi:hypothetical protein